MLEGLHGSRQEATGWRYSAAATTDEEKDLRLEAHDLKKVIAEQILELSLFKKTCWAMGSTTNEVRAKRHDPAGDELAYLPFNTSGGALLFHLLSKIYEYTSVVITTNLSFSEWATVFGDAKMTAALLDRLAHRCRILETGNDSYRVKASSEIAKHKLRDTTERVRSW